MQPDFTVHQLPFIRASRFSLATRMSPYVINKLLLAAGFTADTIVQLDLDTSILASADPELAQVIIADTRDDEDVRLATSQDWYVIKGGGGGRVRRVDGRCNQNAIITMSAFPSFRVQEPQQSGGVRGRESIDDVVF